MVTPQTGARDAAFFTGPPLLRSSTGKDLFGE